MNVCIFNYRTQAEPEKRGRNGFDRFGESGVACRGSREPRKKTREKHNCQH